MSALPAVAPIPVISSTQKGAIYKDILQVAEADYKHVLIAITRQEIEAQARMGNGATGMLVDGSASKALVDVERNVVVWFADRKALAAAIRAAWAALSQGGRRVSGRTAGALRFYYSVGKGGAIRQAGDLGATVANIKNPAALDLYVALPVVHSRRWQWLDKKGNRAFRKTRNKKLLFYSKVMGTKAMRVSRSVFNECARQVQRQFPNLDVKDIYLDSPNLNTGGKTAVDRIPAIKVRMKTRGRGG